MTHREAGYVIPAPLNAHQSWISIGSSGQETILNVSKDVILRRVQIEARDLRILDPLLSYPSTIIARENAIILNLEHIKAIITPDEVLLRNPSAVVPVLNELRRRLRPKNGNGDDDEVGEESSVLHDVEMGKEDDHPFEFLALDVALDAVCSYLSALTIELETAFYPALDMLTSEVSSRNLERVRRLKSEMADLTARVQKVRDELEQLLDDNDDMAELYLSRKLAGSSPVSESGADSGFPGSPAIGPSISRASRASVSTVGGNEKNVQEVEMLLEAYFMQIGRTFNKLNTLRKYVGDTEDYINIQLDGNRNRLLQLDLILSSVAICLSISSLVAGIFGMNIPNKWNDAHGHMFGWVIGVTGAFSGIVFRIIMYYATRKGLFGS